MPLDRISRPLGGDEEWNLHEDIAEYLDQKIFEDSEGWEKNHITNFDVMIIIECIRRFGYEIVRVIDFQERK